MIIYLLVNKGANKRYVGSTLHTLGRIKHRFTTDARRFIDGKIGSDAMIADIAQHGIQNITLIVLEECDLHRVDERKQFWIDYFHTLEPAGYNRPKRKEDDAANIA